MGSAAADSRAAPPGEAPTGTLRRRQPAGGTRAAGDPHGSPGHRCGFSTLPPAASGPAPAAPRPVRGEPLTCLPPACPAPRSPPPAGAARPRPALPRGAVTPRSLCPRPAAITRPRGGPPGRSRRRLPGTAARGQVAAALPAQRCPPAAALPPPCPGACVPGPAAAIPPARLQRAGKCRATDDSFHRLSELPGRKAARRDHFLASPKDSSEGG